VECGWEERVWEMYVWDECVWEERAWEVYVLVECVCEEIVPGRVMSGYSMYVWV
jgi:hypothetical protein